jgi:hypothetical protein
METDLRRWCRLIEAGGFAGDPRFQFHLSVEPNLSPNKSFAEQQRTVSQQGARSDAGDGGEQIYTAHNLQHWTSVAIGNGRRRRLELTADLAMEASGDSLVGQNHPNRRIRR